MLFSRVALVAAMVVGTGLAAHAQGAPALPLNPAAGWTAQTGLLGQGTFFLSTLSNDALTGKTETHLRYGLTSRLSVGLSHLRKQETVGTNFSYTLSDESVEMPSLTVGASHDSPGRGRESYWATAGRTIKDMGPQSFYGYVGVAKLTTESAPRLLVGAALPLAKSNWNVSAQWEGKKLCLGLAGAVGTLGSYPIRLGIMSVGDNTGLLGSTTWK